MNRRSRRGQPRERAADRPRRSGRRGPGARPARRPRRRSPVGRARGRGARRGGSVPRAAAWTRSRERVARLAQCAGRSGAPAGLVEAEPVAEHQPLEPQGHRSEPAGLRRGAPLPEALHLEVQVEPVDDRRQVGLERAAALELARGSRSRSRSSRILTIEAKSSASAPRRPRRAQTQRDHALDDGEFREEPLLASHPAPGRGSPAAPGYPSGSRMIRRKRCSRVLDPMGQSSPCRTRSKGAASLQRPRPQDRRSVRGPA